MYKKIYFIHEIDKQEQYSSIVVKYCTSNYNHAIKFYNEHKETYLDDEDYSLVLAEYNPDYDNTDIESNILSELTTLRTTK